MYGLLLYSDFAVIKILTYNLNYQNATKNLKFLKQVSYINVEVLNNAHQLIYIVVFNHQI